jgi:hypothetical protein
MRQLLTDPRLRVAAHNSVCCAPGCLHPIQAGSVIVKPPGRGWRHADCSKPVRIRGHRTLEAGTR